MTPSESPAPSPAERRTEANLLVMLARIQALEVVVKMIAEEGLLDAELVAESLRKLAAASHQKMLEEIESVDPGRAAALDLRAGVPELDLELELLEKLRLRRE